MASNSTTRRYRTVLTTCQRCGQEFIMDRFVPGDPVPRLAPFRVLTCPHCQWKGEYRRPEMRVRETSLPE